MIDCKQVFELDQAELVARFQAKMPLALALTCRWTFSIESVTAFSPSPRVDEAYKDLIRP